MSPVPSDNAAPRYTLAQMIVAPLNRHMIGLDESLFVVAEWNDSGAPAGPPRPIAPLHIHHTDDEAWYVLEGTLAFRLGDQKVEAPAGAAVFAPRGVPHMYWNPRPTPARYLIIMTQNIKRLIDKLHTTTDRDPTVVQAIYQRHNSTLVL